MRSRSVDQITGSNRYFFANGHHPVFVVRILSSIAPSDSAWFPSTSSFLTTGSVAADLWAHPADNERTRTIQARVVPRVPAHLMAGLIAKSRASAPAKGLARWRAKFGVAARGRRRSRQH